jgi:uncharacterized protein YggE
MKYLFITAAILAAQVQAGEVILPGNGVSSAPADYAAIGVLVESRCYKTATEALKANSTLANEILASLKTYDAGADFQAKLGKENKVVTATPGALERRRLTRYDRKLQDNVVICDGYVMSNLLTLNLGDSSKLAELLDKVAASTDKTTFSEDSKEPQTWARYLGNVPSLFPAHRKELRREAIKSGVASLKADLAALSDPEVCDLSKLELKEININDHGAPSPMPKFAAARSLESADAGGAEGGAATPADLNNVTVNVRIDFKLSYEGGLLQCELPEKPKAATK